MYSPLKQNSCGPSKRVGIVGVGQVSTTDPNRMKRADDWTQWLRALWHHLSESVRREEDSRH